MKRSMLILALPLVLACSGDDGGGGSGTDSSSSDSTSDSTTDSGSGSSSDTAGTGGGTGGSSNVPADGSEDAIAAFLAADAYKGQGWTAETDMPRDPSDGVSPHGRVQVYLNDQVVASQAAGNDGLNTPHDLESMAVKELYDDADALVGKMAMFRALDESWYYFCYGPADRCNSGEPEYPEDAPMYGKDLEVACGTCHNGAVFTELP